MNKKYFLTTAIPYVNAAPHVGFAMELIQGDVLARYHRLKGEEVFFLNGTDENALKNAQAADKAGVPVRQFVDEHAQQFIELNKTLGISSDAFIRTTEERHIQGAQKLWQACDKAGDIYKKKYTGLYCVGCEAFKTEKDLVDGLCPEHKTAPERIEEENYFFRLSKYQNRLLELLEKDQLKITPLNRKNELFEFIKGGLEDFSISRSRERARNWGIPVPGDDSQIMYVWFDALTNYINALGYGTDAPGFNEWWTGHTAHLIGKGIIRFHAIYWPAMLISAGLEIPKEVIVHGYVTVQGEKISKSLGNVIDPAEVVKGYGLAPVRYFLLREIPSGDDGDFSYDNLKNRYNSDLANGLGNLVQRTITLIDSQLSGSVAYRSQWDTEQEVLKKVLEDGEYHQNISQFRLHDALAGIWAKIGLVNAYINEREPWKQTGQEQETTLGVAATAIAHIAWLLLPFLPDTANKIAAILGVPLTEWTDGQLIRVVKEEPLFPRR